MKPGPSFVDWITGRKNDNVTEEEIVSMVNESHEQGNIEASEATMIANIFELDDKEAKDIMTHRKNVVAINADMTLNETAMMILSDGHSRFPVYDEEMDNVIGILYLRDAFLYKEKKGMGNKKLKDIEGLLREAVYIPETRKIQDIFKEMQQKKIHLEVVIDEYGQVSGVVTMEDILEEIVGNIFDEYDEVTVNIVKLSENTYEIDGETPLYEINLKLGIDFGDEDFETLNGYLIAQLDRIPKEDEKPIIDIDRYHYNVLEVKDKMISKVKLTIDEVSEDEDEE